MIYLDNAATTFPKPKEVYEAMDRINRTAAVNAGRGGYRLAREASNMIAETKELILELSRSSSQAKVVFTPSVTVAINQILNGLTFQKNDVIYLSAYEHNAVARTVQLIKEKYEINVIEIPLCKDSLDIDLDKLRYMFSKDKPKFVCCTHVSNVTGYCLPVKEIFEIAKNYGATTILDAAQSLGLIPFSASNLNADFIAFAGHKTLYGPFGIAGFIDNGNVQLKEFLVGGTGSDSLNLNMPATSPERYESASENIVAIAGLNAALKICDYDKFYDVEKQLTCYLYEQLKGIESVTVYNQYKADDVVGIVSFNIDGYMAEDVGMILDEDYDIAVRTGYHCAPYIHAHLKDKEYLGTIRVGIGQFTTKEEVDVLVKAIREIS